MIVIGDKDPMDNEGNIPALVETKEVHALDYYDGGAAWLHKCMNGEWHGNEYGIEPCVVCGATIPISIKLLIGIATGFNYNKGECDE